MRHRQYQFNSSGTRANNAPVSNPGYAAIRLVPADLIAAMIDAAITNRGLRKQFLPGKIEVTNRLHTNGILCGARHRQIRCRANINAELVVFHQTTIYKYLSGVGIYMADATFYPSNIRPLTQAIKIDMSFRK